MSALPRADGVWNDRASNPRDQRLRAAILDGHRQLAAVGGRTLTPEESAALERCRERLALAEAEAARSAYFSAWDCVGRFELDLLSLLGEAELAARCATLKAEAKKKLSDWRAEAAKELMARLDAAAAPPKPGDGVSPESKARLLAAARELKEHLLTQSQNEYHKLALVEHSLRALTWVLVGSVGLVVVLALFGLADKLAILGPRAARHLLIGIGAGALGGLVSMAFSLGGPGMSARIPAVRFSWMVTTMRPMLGAAVAIPVALLTDSGFVKVAGLEGRIAIFAFCFLAGFSERWFLGLMDRLEGAKK